MLVHLSFWIKEKSVATLVNRNICDKIQNLQVSSTTVSHMEYGMDDLEGIIGQMENILGSLKLNHLDEN